MRGLGVSLILATLLFAGPALAGDVNVDKAWFRAMPARLPAAGYFTIHNAGKGKLTLTGATSAACGMLMLHKSSSGGGMASMSDVDSVALPPGGTIAFAPNGLHLMCTDPTPALKPGTNVPVTLLFAGGKRVTAGFVVKNARGR